MDGLNPDDRATLAELYESRFRELEPDDPKLVGWGSRADQLLRFDVLLRGEDVRGRSILDVGCGVGGLVGHLLERFGPDFSYTGIDIAPSLVQHARTRWDPDVATFEVAEVFDLATTDRFDLVVCSGALTYETGRNEEHTAATLERMLGATRDMAAANFLSTFVDHQHVKNHHYDPAAIFSRCKELTRWVTLYHDYPLWEFTVQLRHEPTRGTGSP